MWRPGREFPKKAPLMRLEMRMRSKVRGGSLHVRQSGPCRNTKRFLGGFFDARRFCRMFLDGRVLCRWIAEGCVVIRILMPEIFTG